MDLRILVLFLFLAFDQSMIFSKLLLLKTPQTIFFSLDKKCILH